MNLYNLNVFLHSKTDKYQLLPHITIEKLLLHAYYKLSVLINTYKFF